MSDTNGQPQEIDLEPILRALKGLQYGTIEIVVHASKIVQIDRKERVRLPADDVKKQRRF